MRIIIKEEDMKIRKGGHSPRLSTKVFKNKKKYSRKVKYTRVLLTALLLLFSFLLITVHMAYAWYGKITRVVDGDTFVILDNKGKNHRVRLRGIDCPEYNQPFGKEATKYANKFKDCFVDVTHHGFDRYGRDVVDIFYQKTSINEQLIRFGFCWVYRHYCKDCNDWLNMEQEARLNGDGLWGTINPTPPWQWRHK